MNPRSGKNTTLKIYLSFELALKPFNVYLHLKLPLHLKENSIVRGGIGWIRDALQILDDDPRVGLPSSELQRRIRGLA